MNTVTHLPSPSRPHDGRPTIARKPRALPLWLSDSLPIMVAYLPIAFAFGITARETGLPWWTACGMSVFVFAGAAQMIALGLIAEGQSLATILLTTFLINARFLLLGAALSPLLTSWTRGARLLFGLELTDESFAAIAARFQGADVDRRHASCLNLSIHATWIGGTVLGFALSSAVPDVRAFGLDFALCGMLIGMAFLMIRTQRQLVVGLLSAGVGILAYRIGKPEYAVLAAAILGPTLGVLLERAWPLKR